MYRHDTRNFCLPLQVTEQKRALSVHHCSVPHVISPRSADTLIGNFTVFEMLMYTIDLKCATSLTRAEKESRVDAIIHQLGLQPCRNTLIGVRTSGISGASTCCKACIATHRQVLWCTFSDLGALVAGACFLQRMFRSRERTLDFAMRLPR